MPDKDGKLSPEEKQRAIDWVNVRWVGQNQACPICGDGHWIIGDHLVQPLTVGPENSIQLGGAGYPQVMLISVKCGYTRFLNAVLIGLVGGTPPPDEKKPEG
jgi:ribosomal protein S27AE